MNIQKILLLIGIMVFAGWLLQLNRAGNSGQESTQQEEVIIKGSDTEVQLVSNLAEAFAATNPEIALSVTGGGSSVGIAGILNGEVPVANSSRPLTEAEIEQFQARGINYQTVVVARDGLSVIVNQDNPVGELTLEQLGQIYRGEVTDWSQVSSYSGQISLYGRQSTSGTYSFFRDIVVKADYTPSVKNMEGNQAILDSVVSDKLSIGYVGVGYIVSDDQTPRPGIRVVSLVGQAGQPAISPLDEPAVMAGLYPLFRPIYQFISHRPADDSALKQFLQFEVSAQGQALVKAAGFYPITPEDEQINAWLN